MGKVLKLNNFTVNEENYLLARKGFRHCDGDQSRTKLRKCIYGNFEKKFVHETEWKAFMIDWIRFIDIFMIWKGTKELFINFLNHLNTSVPSI